MYTLENLSCTSKVEVPYYPVPFNKKYTFGVVSVEPQGCLKAVEKYPKCPNCHGKADVLRKKRKVMTKKDIGNKNNSFENSFLEHLLSVGNMIMKAYRKIPNKAPGL